MKKKGFRIVLIVLLCLIAAGFGGLGYYLHQQATSGLFFNETSLNGYDVSGHTCKEVLLALEQSYSAPRLTIQENGEEALTLTLEEMGYTIDEMELLNRLQNCMDQQNDKLLESLMEGNSFEIEIPFAFDETVFAQAVTADRLATPRYSSSDATLEYNDEEYYIEPEVYGNELDDADLQVMVKDYADRMVASDRPQEDGVLDIPDSFYYLPAVTQDNADLNTQMNLYNSFCKARITWTFGETTETIDWSTIQDWFVFEDGEATLLADKVEEYVSNLAYQYDTLYYARDFTATDGTVIHYESSDYGYQIDQSAEVEQLVQDIYNNTATERDPIYSVRGYTRNGRDDLCGNYVEANLTQQHLWFYKDGELVIETDFVSGLPKDGRETITGAFGIPYKKSPETLKGDTWETEVTYWMPFNDGQGLHDASWRTTFGGTIYQTDGSHGCINLPADAAKTIYDNMEERMPIFVYK